MGCNIFCNRVDRGGVGFRWNCWRSGSSSAIPVFPVRRDLLHSAGPGAFYRQQVGVAAGIKLRNPSKKPASPPYPSPPKEERKTKPPPPDRFLNSTTFLLGP